MIYVFNFVTMKVSSIVISTLLSTLMLLNTIKATFNYAYYYIDKEGFIELLCTNKDKPEMQCNGKCHLKKVAENSSNNEKAPEKAVHFDDLILFMMHKSDNEITSKGIKDQPIYLYQNLYSFHNWYNIDHPPQV